MGLLIDGLNYLIWMSHMEMSESEFSTRVLVEICAAVESETFGGAIKQCKYLFGFRRVE